MFKTLQTFYEFIEEWEESGESCPWCGTVLDNGCDQGGHFVVEHCCDKDVFIHADNRDEVVEEYLHEVVV